MQQVKSIMIAISNICFTLCLSLFGGCSSSTTGVKELISLHSEDSELFVSVRCVQIGKNDTMEICYPYHDLVYCLNKDSITQPLCERIEDFVLDGEVLLLPENHFLLQQTIVHDTSVDSIYALGYKQLLREYFFCRNELDKEKCCCLDWLRSACGNSVYFGHWSTPCYFKEGDQIMDDSKQNYIISLLYKHNIYCMLDENGNVCLLNCNLKKEDIIHIPFPIVEIR